MKEPRGTKGGEPGGPNTRGTRAKEPRGTNAGEPRVPICEEPRPMNLVKGRGASQEEQHVRSRDQGTSGNQGGRAMRTEAEASKTIEN